MPGAAKLIQKEAYNQKLCKCLDSYDRAIIVHADNVGSKQMMDIRAAIRGQSTIMMGKNTMMKRCIRLYCERTDDDRWSALLPILVGNVGLVFTKQDLNDIRNEIDKFQVPAPARVGTVAPCDVTCPAGPTGMDPSQTNFFQALNIATKINKGSIEIVSDVPLIKTGEKVGGSEATLLAKLKILPFKYGLIPVYVFQDGSCFKPEVLDIKDEDLLNKCAQAVQNIVAVCLGINIPTIASLPHIVIAGVKNLLAVAVECDYTFPAVEKIMEYLADPDAFMANFAAAAPVAAAAGGAAEVKKEEAPVEEEEEEEDEDMGFSLFD